MERLYTPRDLPDNIDEWSDEIENLLSEWSEIAQCYAWLHNYSQRKYKAKYHHLQIPVIILSTLTGTANFAIDSYVPIDYQSGFSAGVGSLNLFCGILGTLLAFLKYAELYENHRLSAISWSKLSRNIEIELFNKKFNDKYPDVRKPIIVNGLKAIIPFKQDKYKPKPVEATEEPEVEEPTLPEP